MATLPQAMYVEKCEGQGIYSKDIVTFFNVGREILLLNVYIVRI